MSSFQDFFSIGIVSYLPAGNRGRRVCAAGSEAPAPAEFAFMRCFREQERGRCRSLLSPMLPKQMPSDIGFAFPFPEQLRCCDRR